MAWMTSTNSSPQIHNTFGSLGIRHGDTYSVNEDCLAILEEILRKLVIEDQTLRTFRRAIGFGQNIKKDLIPLLIYVKDDTKISDASKIIDTTIQILVNLTVPVECLLSIEAVSRTDVGRHTIFELNRLLATSKEAFTDSRSTKAVMDHMKHMVEKDSNLNMQQCDSINNCLLLLRNILHIPENRMQISNCPLAHSSMQNEIIWNLFTQSIDKIIIYLMSSPHKMYWGVTMVQLIALMYKDQHVGTLQKLLNLWLEASLSESSDGNESNTSPPDQGSGDSSPMITSDPTSDSSDNGGSGKSNDRNKPTNTSENIRTKNTTDVVRAAQNRSKALAGMKRVKSTETETSTSSGAQSTDSGIGSSNSSKISNQQSPSSSIDKADSPTSIQMSQSQHSNQSPLTNQTEQMNQAQTPMQTQSSNHIQNANQTQITTHGATKNRECPSSQSEVSDCGYVTQVENQESISTSSNDDDQPHQKPVHQKPHTFQKSRYNNCKSRTATALEKKELRRKKLVKRSKTNIINMKGLMHHTPTDEDISNILKEFTVDFLLKGYGSLVGNLHSHLLTTQVQIDTSHFFWLVTYFLKFATQLELDLEHISPVLSYEIISYLIFQGVWLYEELEVSSKIPDFDLKPCLRRLHLVVTAIREFLQAVETYQKLIHLSDEDRALLIKLQKQIVQTEDLKCLFLLLLRQYNPIIQSKQYLQDLIVTNHIYLLFSDNITKSENLTTNIMDHLKEFATVEIMKQYGLLLEGFRENGEFVNNCVFTMMHHIGGDLDNVSTLFQPSILKTFSQIWETDYEICDDWSDLLEYVIHKFINTPRSNKCSDISTPSTPQVLEKEDGRDTNKPCDEKWTTQNKNNLLEYFNMSKSCSDAIANITKKYQDEGIKSMTQVAIIKELLEQSIINQTQYEEFTTLKNRHQEELDCAENLNMDVTPSFPNEASLVHGDIKVLKEYLFKENKGRLIIWLQNIVVEACYVKLALGNTELLQSLSHIMEPSVYYYTLLNLPIPVVPWTSEQFSVLKHQPFILLLHKLGFYLPADTGKIFVRIPNFWTADYLFSIAQQLGPIDSAKLKFDVNLLEGIRKSDSKHESCDTVSISTTHSKFSMTEQKHTPSMVRYTPLPNSTEWIQNILKFKVAPVTDKALHISSRNELSIIIPEIEPMACNIPPPELRIAEPPRKLILEEMKEPIDMDISPSEDNRSLNEDIEHNSIYETSSVASDLTRMCRILLDWEMSSNHSTIPCE